MNTDREHQTKQSRWGFRGMTVREWLPIVGALLVPVVIALGIWAITWQLEKFENQRAQQAEKFENQRAQQAQKLENQRAETERELTEQRGQDEALQAYLDQMSQLILDRKLLEVDQGDPVHRPGDPVYTLAQARTSTVILKLDAEHNESVIRFLIDSGLAVSGEASVRLLRKIALSDATLSGAHLTKADLGDADLRDADLSYARLSDANLSKADLSGAKLYRAILSYANLRDANEVTNEQLSAVFSLEGATMPEGQYVTREFKPALSFSVSADWRPSYPETTDDLSIEGPERGQLNFTSPLHVFDPSSPSEPKEVPAPENAGEWVSWFQKHPNLNTSKPLTIGVGGTSGKQIDVTASSTPENYPRDLCGELPCVPLYPKRDESAIVSHEDWKDRFIIVDVGGETVLIDVAAPVDKFDEFHPKALKVLDTVEWSESE